MRARTTWIAVTVVGVALALAALAFLWVTRERIESTITASARSRLDGVVSLVTAGVLSDPLPGGDPELLAQVVDASFQVVAADRLLVGRQPMSRTFPPPGERVERPAPNLFEELEETENELEDTGPYLMISEGIVLPDGPGAVLVAASLEDADEAVEVALPLLGLGLPLLLAIVGGTTWVLTGRALRPVEEIRTEAERISHADLHRRLPIPGSRDEINRLAMTLNQMLARLEASAIRQRRFVSDASHELRSPLATLRTMLEVTRRRPADPEPAAFLSDFGLEIDRMQRLVDDLLFLAQQDEGVEVFRGHKVDLDQIVAVEAASLRQRTGLEVDVSGIQPLRIIGETDRLFRLIRNLTDNAISHAAGRIWLETRVQDGAGVLVVSNDGPGIPPADRERVFERFVRLDESRTRGTGGAGLGLALARAIAISHGGSLRAIEPRHGGVSFEARFPIPG